MSIRLRFTLLYNTILAVTLAIFGVALFSVQSGVTYNALQQDIIHSSNTIGNAVLEKVTGITIPGSDQPAPPPIHEQRPPVSFQNLSNDQLIHGLPEREIVRILNADGSLLASPFGTASDALPLSTSGLAALKNQQDWWETAVVNDSNMLIYSRPVVEQGKTAYIVQVARSLDERDHSLTSLGNILLVASLVTLLAAFGIGWVLSGITLQPIQRITQTASSIGEERDFTRRVAYAGPQDEVGQLASTFNNMLSRLQDAYQQVAHSLEMQRDFVADVSHELRTPLTTLRGNLGLLRRTPAIPAEEQADILADMVDESDRLIRLVNDLLVLARADAGRNLAQERISLQPILEETVRQARHLAPNRSIQLEAADLPLRADRDAVKQVFLIVLDNAIKHSSGDVLVTAARDGERVRIQVRDFGAGIPPEKLEHIFDRFYRGATGDITGFGLGLPIAKSLVEGMGGHIHMESEVGQGSTLIMEFPVAE